MNIGSFMNKKNNSFLTLLAFILLGFGAFGDTLPFYIRISLILFSIILLSLKLILKYKQDDLKRENVIIMIVFILLSLGTAIYSFLIT
ncbi:hypothetical protein GCM10022217_19610 [Chryseobacterium ginsenosidimutans]|uniref:hypothetical protein n=1 Tax=Chryseobacterium ginsenosidimutans TaxID=687846 RepID=UPI0031DA507C